MDNHHNVQVQYANSQNLDIRIAFQEKYSQNKYGFGPWLMDQYEFPANARVLEIGCGTGGMWLNRQELIDSFEELMLTDFSLGMLADAKKKLQHMHGIRFQAADIRSLPFEDASYDFIIANMMLYHVSDREKAIAEVRRVLKPGGTFVCATYGENNIVPYLKKQMEGILPMRDQNNNFTLQNGGAQLEKQFAHVERRDYPDEFIVDDANAIIRYLTSMTNIVLAQGDCYSRELLVAIMQSCIDAAGGQLRIAKEYGTFVCR